MLIDRGLDDSEVRIGASGTLRCDDGTYMRKLHLPSKTLVSVTSCPVISLFMGRHRSAQYTKACQAAGERVREWESWRAIPDNGRPFLKP